MSLSTKETTNYARLCGLLVDVGPQALRVTFDRIHAPGSLHTVLANLPAHSILQSLKKILNPNQWNKLYPAIPSSVSSVNFDITLLTILLRNTCGLSPPATGWNTLPPPGDTSTEADIARVSCFRDTVYSHAKQASVDDAGFNNYWQDIRTTLVRLGGPGYGADIDQFKSACMTPEMEEYYQELLQQWKKEADSLMEDATSSNRETTNYARLCRLLVNVGSQALRDTFDHIHTPQNLHIVLSSPTVQPILQNLYMPPRGRRKILDLLQWSKLYPAIPGSVSSANFDITLLMILLRNICGLSPPATGWDALPPPGDTSIEADIARVKYFRNTVYGHAEEASVDEMSFSNYWQDIKEPLVRLGGPSYEAAIDQLKIASMDPEVEEHYKELLKQWKKDEDSIKDRLEDIESDIKSVRKKLDDLTEIVSPKTETIVEEIATCDADIAFFAERHDPVTRQWLLDDFSRWFIDPGESRAYVLLGDAGVGKSVMAGVLAQRMRRAGNLGAAYFCRHNDGTRNNPRYLLGTIAYQLCKCNSQYNNVVGGEGGIRKLLGNSELGVQELFTKLLLESLAKCNSCQQRTLVVIDALDETKYESRDDFLDLIMNRFPQLPKWLVFFITSRPEHTVQFRLKTYNPCIKICSGNSENLNFYQHHEQDIKRFLEKRVDFSFLPYSVEDIADKCNGLFLYAFFIARFLMDPANSGKIGQLTNLLPRDIEDFFLQNFKRVSNKVGAGLYKKLFGCAIVAPSPLPVSFISFILQREHSDLEEQEITDAVSLFVVLRTSDKTFAFLHNLIPAWLTDKEKASPKFFVDRIKAGEYFRDIIVECLSAFVDKQAKGRPSTDDDILDYVVRVGVRFLSGFYDKVSVETIFRCLTSFKFIQRRIRNNRIEIYSLIEDFKLSAECQADVDVKKQVRHEICSALESNVYVLSEFPNLLHNCFRFTSKTARSVVIPDCVSTVWMEYSWLPRPASKIRRDMSCLALSPDKKLLAGGSEGFIYLFDACTFEKVQGPIKVLEMNIDHLEFSPDGKFLFFGKLDKWFSVDQGCVKELPQFAGNYRFYKWGSFIFDGRYIVVEGIDPELRGHELNCLVNIFGMWAMRELEQMPEFDITSLRVSDRFESFRLSTCNRQVKKKHSIFKHLIQNALGGVKSLCPKCSEFEKSYEKKSLALLRQRVIELYPEIFKYQIWDITSGRPALEEAFSPGVQLNPFFFLCHLTNPFDHDDTFFTGAEKSVSLCTIAFVNALFYLSFDEYGYFYTHRARSEDLGKSFWLSSLVVTNTPRGFENWPARGRSTVSPDRTWIAVKRSNNEVHLFNKKMQLDHFDYGKPDHVIKEAVDYVTFAEDSSFLLYLTEHGSPHALCLQTGSVLSSVSGFILQSTRPGKEVGYCFRSGNEETIIFARHFVGGLCGVLSIPPFTSPHLTVTYSSADTIKSISSCAILTSWKRTNSDLPFTVVSRCCSRAMASPAPSGGREAQEELKNCAFSRNGELLATHQGSKILLLKYDEFSIYTVYEGEDDYTVSCLTFSADSTLLLFCMKRCNNTSSFSVWDVQNKVVLSSKLLYLLAVDCCCFSSDNMKVIICDQLNIQIWEYAGHSCRRLKALEPPGLCTGFDKFTHCSVSSNNQMLACCIRDKILLYPFNPPRQQDVLEIPHGHLGRVEFCQFLKGTRYLISYGVDGTVFLCDINEWKAVAYARVTQGSESIVSMAVSPEEDEVVCLTSLDRFCIIQLCGLKCAKLSSFPLLNMNASERVTPVESRGQQRERTVPTFQGAATSDNKDISENDWLFMLSSDENEDSEEDELESDRWASNIRCT